MKTQILVAVTSLALGGLSACQQPAADEPHAAVVAAPDQPTDRTAPAADATATDEAAESEPIAKRRHYRPALTHRRIRHRTTTTR